MYYYLMVKNSSPQTGSAHVIIIVVLIVALVGTLGFVFWQNFINTEVSSDQTKAPNKEKNVSVDDSVEKDRTAAWYEYKPDGNEYSIRLPDGWKLFKPEGGGSVSLYGFMAEDITYEAGTKATISEVGGRGWGAIPFMLNYYPDSKIVFGVDGSKQSSFKTKGGLTVDKYYNEVMSDPDVMGPPKGTKQYFYELKKDNYTIVVQHDITPSEVDQTALIEEAIKTLIF